MKLEVFEGPLDLLLHLIKKEEVDIYDIPVARITDEYLQYLNLLETMNLDVAGEYLVMAATLTHIKSRMLLPPSEEEAEEPDEDPRADLVQQLVEYQRYREAAVALGERAVLTRDVFRRDPAAPDDDQGEGIRLRDVTVGDLLEAFREVMERRSARASTRSSPRRSRSRSASQLIVRRMEMDGPLRFRDLFAGAPVASPPGRDLPRAARAGEAPGHPGPPRGRRRRDPVVPASRQGVAHLDDVP